MAARLKVLKDGVEVQNVDLERFGNGSILLGRAENADIRIDDRAIGREHAVFQINGNVIAIHKKSKFGRLAINGAETSEGVVKPGDVVSISEYLLRFENADGAAPAAGPEASAAAASNVVLDHQPDLNIVPEAGTPAVASLIGTASGSSKPLAVADIVEHPSIETPSRDSIALEEPVESPGSKVAMGAGLDGGTAGAVDAGERTSVFSAAKVSTKLVFSPGTANVEELEIKKPEISIGRGSGCDVVLVDKKASRKHLILRRAGLNFVAVDLGSGNGTFVNGVRITEQELAGDDVLKIGDTEFVFKAVSQDYLRQEQNQEFMTPLPEPEPEPQDDGALAMYDPGGVPTPMAGSDPHEAQTGPIATGIAGGAIPGWNSSVGQEKSSAP